MLCLDCQLRCQAAVQCSEKYEDVSCLLQLFMPGNASRTLADQANMKGSVRHNETSMKHPSIIQTFAQVCRAARYSISDVMLAVYKLFPKFYHTCIFIFNA